MHLNTIIIQGMTRHIEPNNRLFVIELFYLAPWFTNWQFRIGDSHFIALTKQGLLHGVLFALHQTNMTYQLLQKSDFFERQLIEKLCPMDAHAVKSTRHG